MIKTDSYRLKVGEVAKIFKVHPDTIRRWNKKGLIRSVRHPMNQYRLFDLENVKRIVENING